MTDVRTLLLIDDDVTTRELLSLLLSNAGWSVTAVAGGDEALDVLRSATPPAVILSDLQMPGLTETPLAQAIRDITTAPVLLAMTATPLATAPEGYDALLIKPFRPELVLQHYDAITHLAMGADALDVKRDMTNTPDDDASVLNPAVLAQLQATMTAARLHALLAFVVDDADGRITRMGAAASIGDDDAYRKEAHALKGSCSMVGAQRLRELAACAEDEGLPQGALTEWKPAADFVAATAAIRLMLETLSRNEP